MYVTRMKSVAPQTCTTNIHQDELLSLIRSVQSAALYPETEKQTHVSIPLISSGVLIKDILDDGKIFIILEKQLEIPKNMTIDNIYLCSRSPVEMD